MKRNPILLLFVLVLSGGGMLLLVSVMIPTTPTRIISISNASFVRGNGKLHIELLGGCLQEQQNWLAITISTLKINLTFSKSSSDIILEAELFDRFLFPNQSYDIQINSSFADSYNAKIVYKRCVYYNITSLFCNDNYILMKVIRFPLYYVVFPPDIFKDYAYQNQFPLLLPQVQHAYKEQLNSYGHYINNYPSVLNWVVNLNNPSELYALLKTKNANHVLNNVVTINLSYYNEVNYTYTKMCSNHTYPPEADYVSVFKNRNIIGVSPKGSNYRDHFTPCVRPPSELWFFEPPFIAIHKTTRELLLAKEISPDTCSKGAFSGQYFKSLGLDYNSQFYRMKGSQLQVYRIGRLIEI